MKKICLIALVSWPVFVAADIYKFTDTDGRVYYSPEPKPGYVRIVKSYSEHQVTTKNKHTVALVADTQTPIEKFKSDSFYAFHMCSLSHELFLLTGKKTDYEKFSTCLDDGRRKTKLSYQAAVASTNNQAVKSALKEFHVKALSALSKIYAGSDERKISYETRQQAISDELTEAWARVDVELELAPPPQCFDLAGHTICP